MGLCIKVKIGKSTEKGRKRKKFPRLRNLKD